jgi:hypothetical protein
MTDRGERMRLREYAIDAIVDHLRLLVFALATLLAAFVLDLVLFGFPGPIFLLWALVLGFFLALVALGPTMAYL